MRKKKEAAIYPPSLPKRPEIKKDGRWPSPMPFPPFPPEDVERILKQILVRLTAVERRLENIEKILLRDERPPR